MLSGNIIVNGIDDKQLIILLKVKLQHEQSLIFNPGGLQPVPGQPQRPGQPAQPPNHQQSYNNAQVSWNNESGLKAVKQLLHELTEKSE
jgi:hypothetical protein